MWNDNEEEEETDKVYIGAHEEEEIGERDERRSLMDTIFSWSIEEIVNRDLYRGEVPTIPKSFSSSKQYINSFFPPLIEEVHAGISCSLEAVSQAAIACVSDSGIQKSRCEKNKKSVLYEMSINKSAYTPKPADIILISESIQPKNQFQIRKNAGSCTLGWVIKVKRGNILHVRASKRI
ncbi:uncharacterized protein LOC144563886 [Carex rostrata]